MTWNASLLLEFRPLLVNSSNYDIYIFVAFQRLPGPNTEDHDFMFQMKYHDQTNHLFISSEDLHNRTGLFYVGIGVLDNGTVPKNQTVSYLRPETKSTWAFIRGTYFDFNARVLSKGCYYFDASQNRFDSSGLKTNFYVGDTFVQCQTFHLTTFSVGLISVDIDAVRSPYNYVVDFVPRNLSPTLIALFMSLHMLVVLLINIWSEQKDDDKGRLHMLKDNHPMDSYQYIITIETGYRMFATSNSQVYLNLSGTAAEEICRHMNAADVPDKLSTLFNWGTSTRFLMTTPWSLGNLTYLRLWVDGSGSAHRESWYCESVIVKDLQTQEIYHFPVKSWLGNSTKDGKTEQLISVHRERHFLKEATSMGNLSETISYIAMYTGGGHRMRGRVPRSSHTLSIFLAHILISLLNCYIVEIEDFNRSIGEKYNIINAYSLKDTIVGISLSLLILPLTSLLPFLLSRIASSEEAKTIRYYKKINPDFKIPKTTWSHGWKCLITSLAMSIIMYTLGLLFAKTFELMEDQAVAFTRRYFIMLFIWCLVTEPIKGVTAAYVILKFWPSHKMCTALDEAFLPIKCIEDFEPAPDGQLDKSTGQTISDLMQLKENRDKRMRDEQLFETMRDIIYLFISLFITLGLTYYCRDRQGFYYQKQIRSLLNVENTKTSKNSFSEIKTTDDFWNWAEKDLVTGLRVSWYDGQPAWNMRGFVNDKVSRAMGTGNIRQIRSISNKSCSVLVQFQNYFTDCEADISENNEDQTPQYSAGWKKWDGTISNALPEYKFKTAEELKTRRIRGAVNTYGGGGYTISLDGTASDLIKKLRKLESENWLDENTRALIVEFSVYNAQVNYFAVVELVLEHPSEGYWYSTGWVEAVRLIKYQGDEGEIVVVFEVLYLCYAVITFIKELIYYSWYRYRAFKKQTPSVLPWKIIYNIFAAEFSLWELVDFFIGILALISIIAYGIRYVSVMEAVNEFTMNNGNSYINLSRQRDVELLFTSCLGGVVFFVSCKMIRILRFNRRIGVLAVTLEKAGMAIGGFAVVFIIIVVAFDASLYYLLWNQIEEYKTMIMTFETSIAAMLGKFAVKNIAEISQLGSIIFIVFMYIGTLFLINFFVTIVLHEFELVRNDRNRQTNEYELLDHLQSKLMRTIGLYERSDMPAGAVVDVRKDFRQLDILLMKVNLLHHRVNTMRDEDKLDRKKYPRVEISKSPNLLAY